MSWMGNGGPSKAKVTANVIGGIIIIERIIMITNFLSCLTER
jgi:hypothetical protein